MKYVIKFTLVATIGLVLFLSIDFLPQVAAVQQTPNHSEALAFVQTGKKYYDSGKLWDAVNILQKAEKIYKVEENILAQAQTLSLISLAYQQLGSISEAQAAINTSLSLLDKVQIHSSDFKQVRAQVLNRHGRLQWAMGNAQAALDNFQSAESLYTQAQDKQGSIGSQINQAQALQSLGFYRRSYKLLESVKKELQKQPDSSAKVAGLHNLGNILRERGELDCENNNELDCSQEVLHESLTIAKKLNHADKSSTQQSFQYESKILLSLGNAKLVEAARAKNFKNEQEEKRYQQSALNYYQNAAITATSPTTKIQAYLNQLSLLVESLQLKPAQTLLPKIYNLLKQLPVSRESVYAHVNFADNLIKLSNTEDKQIKNYNITQILNNAINQAKTLEDERAESYALGTLGKLYEKSAEWTQATNYTQSALMISQRIMASDMTYQWDWQMGRILQTQDNISEAINYYTLAFDILKELRGDLVSLNPEFQFSFREKVEPVYRDLVDLLLHSTKPGTKNLKKAREVIEALQLAELDNFFGDACAKPEPVNIDNLDVNAAVLYPIILKNRLEVIVKLPGASQFCKNKRSKIIREELSRIVWLLQSWGSSSSCSKPELMSNRQSSRL